MRDDQVENGVNFLIHPKVKAAPLSQRISFLENKGLTSDEISAALSRVEAKEGGDGKSFAGNSFESANSTLFPTEQDLPLWRKAAVPGALVLGAVGALGTYHLAARAASIASSTASSSDLQPGQQQQQVSARGNGGRYASCNGGANGRSFRQGNESVNGGLDHVRDEYLDRHSEGEDGCSALVDEAGNGGTTTASGGLRSSGDLEAIGGPPPADSTSRLAGEFRRLSEAMRQQTGQLVEAVGAMKTLASRAEQDSTNLLAARVSSHTSELRAELSTIKHLLLLQSGQGGAAATTTAGSGKDGEAGSAEGGAMVAGATAPSISEVGAPKTTGGLNGNADGVSTTRTAGTPARNGSILNGVPRQVEVASAGRNGVSATVPRGSLLPEEGDTKAGETAAQGAAQAALIARRKEAARAALSSILASNAPRVAKDGIAMLRMLVANLVRQPNVPRYRRIATSNDNFKKRVLPLEGHQAMMEAIGFKSKGSAWEWTWHEDSGRDTFATNRAVLEDVMAAIDAAVRPNGPPPPPASSSSSSSSSPPPPPPLPTTWPPQLGYPPTVAASSSASAAASAVDGTISAGSSRTVAAAPRNHSLAALLGNAPDQSDRLSAADTDLIGRKPQSTDLVGDHLRALNGQANRDLPGSLVSGIRSHAGSIADTSAVQPSAPAREGENLAGVRAPSSVATGSAARVAPEVGAQENHGGIEVSSKEEAAHTKGEMLPPVSMVEVAAAIERGEQPPGIRCVEDRLSSDASVLASSTSSQPKLSPRKPWEAVPGAQAISLNDIGSPVGGIVGADRAGDAEDRTKAEDGGPLESPIASSSSSQGAQPGLVVGP